MEIKVQCDCGQKFKFDVEPANGRMPYAIACPVCGADATARANAVIAQSVPPPPVAPGLRIGLPQQAAPVAQLLSTEPSSTPTPPPLPPTRPFARPPAKTAKPPAKSGGANRLMQVFVVLVVAAALVGFGIKCARRISFIKDIAQAIKEAGTNDVAGAYVNNWTLPDDDGTAVIIKHTNETAVAQACADYWAQTFRKKMTIKNSTNLFETDEDAVYMVEPAHNGCVKIDGPLFWDEKETATMNGLALFLSRKFATTSVCAMIGDDAESGVFTVYENGEKEFRCERHIMIKNGDIEEVVKVDGDAWATGLGFKPGEGGYKGFTMEDANELTHHLGLKLAGRPEITYCLELKEPGRKQQ
jgi:hypothetical protein